MKPFQFFVTVLALVCLNEAAPLNNDLSDVFNINDVRFAFVTLKTIVDAVGNKMNDKTNKI